MCRHQHRCPEWPAPDHFAARIVADQPGQGWSLLCSGVIVSGDRGDLLRHGCAVVPGHCQRADLMTHNRLKGHDMSYASVVKAQRARRNRAYVRELLRQRQPAFAAALTSAELYLSCALAQRGIAGTRRRAGSVGRRLRPVCPATVQP
jgi:hypothetical protein